MFDTKKLKTFSWVNVANPDHEDFERLLNEYKIDEDNMNVMYSSMLEYLDGKKNDSLTVKDYSPIAQTLCNIEEIWNTQKNK